MYCVNNERYFFQGMRFKKEKIIVLRIIKRYVCPKMCCLGNENV